MRARPLCTYALPFLALRVRLELAKAYWVKGDRATARHLLREIDGILLHQPFLVFWSSRSRSLIPYLQTHLTFSEIGIGCSYPATPSPSRPMDEAKPKCSPSPSSPATTDLRCGRQTRWNGSTRRSNAEPAWSASFRTSPPSSASSVPSGRHARRMAGQRPPLPIRRLHGPTQTNQQ